MNLQEIHKVLSARFSEKYDSEDNAIIHESDRRILNGISHAIDTMRIQQGRINGLQAAICNKFMADNT